MKNAGATLSQYLLSRGLNEPFLKDQFLGDAYGEEVADPLFEDEEILERAAGIYNDNDKILKVVIRRRLKAMRDELTMKAPPEEVIVIRQAMIEVASILDDFKKASDELERRRQQREEAPKEEEPEDKEAQL